MKKNRITILLVIVLAIVAVVLVSQNRSGTLRSEVGDFAIDDTSTVTQIFMADMQGNEVLLQKMPAGNWSLNDSLNARAEGIGLLLTTMSKLAVKAPVSKSTLGLGAAFFSILSKITFISASVSAVGVFCSPINLDTFGKD